MLHAVAQYSLNNDDSVEPPECFMYEIKMFLVACNFEFVFIFDLSCFCPLRDCKWQKQNPCVT